MLNGESTNWLRLSETDLSLHYESQMLRDFSVEYATLLSYQQTENLVQKRMGNDSLSDQRIFHIVSEYCAKVKLQQDQQIKNCESIDYNCVSHKVDIYDSVAKEVVFLSDGVCVCEQKCKRDGIKKTGKERTTTNIMMLQTSHTEVGESSYKTIIAASGIDTIKLVQSELLLAYGKAVKSLPIVAISDGARSIKNENKVIFGEGVIHILDWYHLQAKVHQLMSQIATNKELKIEFGPPLR